MKLKGFPPTAGKTFETPARLINAAPRSIAVVFNYAPHYSTNVTGQEPDGERARAMMILSTEKILFLGGTGVRTPNDVILRLGLQYV